MEQVSLIGQGDLLLVPFPFSDQSGRKVRPVIVMSNDDFNSHSDDLIVVGVTSSGSVGKYTLDFSTNDLNNGKLFLKCYIKVENILKLDKELVIKRIGSVKEEKMKLIEKKILEIIRIR